jgi:hypothetical protein
MEAIFSYLQKDLEIKSATQYNGLIRRKVMKLYNLKRTIAASAFGLIALLGTSEIANAQNNKKVQKQQQKVVKQQQKVLKQQQKLSVQQQRVEQERFQLAQQRQREEQIRLQNQRNRNANINSNNNRYRIYRGTGNNGGYYQTDNRGAELLRQAVNNISKEFAPVKPTVQTAEETTTTILQSIAAEITAIKAMLIHSSINIIFSRDFSAAIRTDITAVSKTAQTITGRSIS